MTAVLRLIIALSLLLLVGALLLSRCYEDALPAAVPRAAEGRSLSPSVKDVRKPLTVYQVGTVLHVDARGSAEEISSLLTQHVIRWNVSHMHPSLHHGITSGTRREERTDDRAFRLLLFCPSHEALEEQEHIRQFPSARVINSSVLLRLAQCPAPMLLHIVRAPLAFSYNALSMFPCVGVGVLDTVLVPRTMVRGLGGPTGSDDERWGRGGRVAVCATACLAHPCCLAFQVDEGEGPALLCRLLHCRFNLAGQSASRKSKVAYDFGQATYFLGHLRDVRVSATAAVTIRGRAAETQLRLVVAEGAAGDGVIRLDRHNEWSGSRFVVELVDATSGYMQLPRVMLDTAVTATILRPANERTGSDRRIVGHRTAVMVGGRAAFPAVVPVYQSLVDYVGQWLELQFEAHIVTLASTAAGEGVGRVSSEVFRFYVQRSAPDPWGQRRLHFISPGDTTTNAPFHHDAVRASAELHQLIPPPERPTSSDSATCAALLAPDECCLHTLVATLTHTEYDNDFLVSSAEFVSRRVRLRLGSALSGRNASAVLMLGHPCAVIVDGNHARYSRYGAAYFQRLVLRRLCNASQLRSAPPLLFGLYDVAQWADETPKEEDSDVPPAAATVAVPADVLASCGRRDAARQPQEPPPPGGESDVPVLFSVAVHECMTCIRELLTSLAAFASPCVVVMHISESWALSESETAELLGMRGEPQLPKMVFVNTNVVKDTQEFLHKAHLSNTAFMLRVHPSVQWSHVVFFSSNELLVRRGIVEYMRMYDLSRAIPSPASSFVFAHHEERWWISAADARWRATRMIRTAFLQPGIASFLSHKGIRELPNDFVLLEGSFLSRRVAKEVIASYFDWYPDSFTCIDGRMLFPPSEGEMIAVLADYCTPGRNLRCGERVSALVHANAYFLAQMPDLWRVRCSPFATPFGFKRVDRTKANPLRQEIMRIAGNQTERAAWRVVGDARCTVW
jgi:hypothetical protein